MGGKSEPRECAPVALTKFIVARTKVGEEIILSIDVNERLLEGGRMREFLTSTGLIDPIEARHGVPPRTCVRGKHRIDYILISPSLQSAVTRAGHLGIHDAIQSDHCGIWLEFDGRKLFRGSTEHLGSTVEAPFTAREISKMDKYVATMEAHLKETKGEERLKQLITENQLQEDVFIETYEKISRDIDEAMKAGMNKVRRKNVGFARSPELTRAASLVRYWKTQLRATRNKVVMFKATLTFAKKNDLPVTVQLYRKYTFD